MTDTFGLGIQNHHQTVSLTHGSSHALFQTPVVLFCDHQFINNDFYIMILVAVEFHAMRYFTHFTIHPYI